MAKFQITEVEKKWALRSIVFGVALYFISEPIKDMINGFFGGNKLVIGILLMIIMLYFWEVK